MTGGDAVTGKTATGKTAIRTTAACASPTVKSHCGSSTADLSLNSVMNTASSIVKPRRVAPTCLERRSTAAPRLACVRCFRVTTTPIFTLALLWVTLALLVGVDARPAAAQAKPDKPTRADGAEMPATDVASLLESLDKAKERLAAGDTSGDVQAAQRAALAAFDRLIAASQPDSKGAQGGGNSGGKSGSKKPEDPPKDPEDEKPDDAKKPDSKPESKSGDQDKSKPGAGAAAMRGPGGENWGKLRDRTVAPLLNNLREKKFPPRYQALLEQYYRSFQDD